MDPEALVWYLAVVPVLMIIGVITLKVLGREDLLLRPRPPAAAVLRRLEPGESVSAGNAARLVRKVVALAERLASQGAVITEAVASWTLFGCWSLTVQIPPSPTGITPDSGKVLKAFWDGRGRRMTFHLQWSDSRSAVRMEQQIHEYQVARESDPMVPAEEYLTKALSLSQEPETGSPAREAIAVVQKIGAFAERLAARNIVIADLECHSVPVESWLIHLYNGGETDKARSWNRFAVRVKWDGGTRVLSVEVSPLRSDSFPFEFKTEFEQRLALSDDPVGVAENYLCEVPSLTAR